MTIRGFTVLELLLVISLLGLIALMVPGLQRVSLWRMEDQNEVQNMVDLLRWAQRRAIIQNVSHYLTLNPAADLYRIYEFDGNDEVLLTEVVFKGLDLVGINRSVQGMDQTFYFTPQGTPVFGCTITLADEWCLYKVIIGVGSGKIRIARE